MMRKLLFLATLLYGTAQAQVVPVPIGPAHFVQCTNGASGAADVAILASAATAGGQIMLTANCTVNATTTLNSNTVLNGNGYTVTGAASSNWAGSTVAHFFAAATNAVNITVQNTNFVCPASATGAVHVLQFPSGNSHIKVINNTFNLNNACGDATADVGTTDVYIAGNTALGASNACYDNWNGAQDVEIAGNYCSTWTTGGAGTAAYGVLWTGF